LTKTGKTSIIFGEEIGIENTAIATTTLNTKNNTRQISIVGPTRMNYSKAKALLEFLKNEVENLSNNNTNE
jgi:heat-inducible transcriptional repressor